MENALSDEQGMPEKTFQMAWDQKEVVAGMGSLRGFRSFRGYWGFRVFWILKGVCQPPSCLHCRTPWISRVSLSQKIGKQCGQAVIRQGRHAGQSSLASIHYGINFLFHFL